MPIVSVNIKIENENLMFNTEIYSQENIEIEAYSDYGSKGYKKFKILVCGDE